VLVEPVRRTVRCLHLGVWHPLDFGGKVLVYFFDHGGDPLFLSAATPRFSILKTVMLIAQQCGKAVDRRMAVNYLRQHPRLRHPPSHAKVVDWDSSPKQGPAKSLLP
jgi:hypothetical protein